MSETAKPFACPFCGDVPTVKLVAGSAWVKCRNTQCRTETGLYRSEYEAIARWNHRAADPRLAALETTSKAVIAGLEAQIRDLKLELKMKEGR
jgi:hypothetical protein